MKYITMLMMLLISTALIAESPTHLYLTCAAMGNKSVEITNIGTCFGSCKTEKVIDGLSIYYTMNNCIITEERE